MLSINKCYLGFVNKILNEGKETYKDSNHHLKESLGNFYIIYDPNRIYEHFGINQFETMKERLLNNIGSNRAVAVTIDPKLDSEREDIPCLQFLQFIVRDGKLTVHCIFRSNDIFGAFYSNMFFIGYLGLKMTETVNKELIRSRLVFDGIHYHSTSGHIYHNDLKAAKKLVKGNLE